MNKRLVLCMVLVLSMLLSTVTFVQATDAPKFSLRATDWTENNEFDLIISIENNPGIAGFKVSVTFDSVLLKPVSAEGMEALPSDSVISNLEKIIPGHTKELSLAWFQATDFKESGDIIKVHFALSEYASSENSGQNLEFTFGETNDIANQALERVELDYGSCTVSIPEIEGEGTEFVPVEVPEETPVEPKPKVKIVLTIDSVEIGINKNTLINDVAPIIVNDRTMLPVRVIAENMVPVAEVSWDETLQKVTVTSEGDVIEVIIGSSVAYVNGEEKELDSPAFIKNDRTYLPVRFIAESLKANVDWNEELQQVTITK